MIASSRQYIKDRIAECKSDYKEIDDPTGFEDLELSRIEDSYKIVFGTMTTITEGSYYTSVVPCTVEVYKKAKASGEVDSFDQIFDDAICIRDTIINPITTKNTDIFTDIEPLSIEPQPLPDNDKVFKILITLQIRKDFDFQGA